MDSAEANSLRQALAHQGALSDPHEVLLKQINDTLQELRLQRHATTNMAAPKNAEVIVLPSATLPVPVRIPD